MSYELCKSVMTDDTKRHGFNTLIHNTFWLSFEEWYQNGEWGDWNQPYTLYAGEKAIANVTVNHMKALYEGRERNYIQLGGIATDPEYRGKGLSGKLIETVIRDWESQCDAIFLVGNDSVTHFYPKFGFVEEQQYQYFKRVNSSTTGEKAPFRQLDLNKEQDRQLLYQCYQKRNPFSRLQFIDNFSLLQFYCHYGMNECMYYLQDEDALVIFKKEDGVLKCYDVYYSGSKSLMQLVECFVDETVSEVRFLFTPIHTEDLEEEKIVEADVHLFVLKGKEDLFAANRLQIPDISHT